MCLSLSLLTSFDLSLTPSLPPLSPYLFLFLSLSRPLPGHWSPLTLTHSRALTHDDKQDVYQPPLSPGMYSQLAVLLLLIGIVFSGQFFVYEVNKTTNRRSIFQELYLAVVASLFLGVGIFFLSLTVGLPV